MENGVPRENPWSLCVPFFAPSMCSETLSSALQYTQGLRLRVVSDDISIPYRPVEQKKLIHPRVNT